MTRIECISDIKEKNQKLLFFERHGHQRSRIKSFIYGGIFATSQSSTVKNREPWLVFEFDIYVHFPRTSHQILSKRTDKFTHAHDQSVSCCRGFGTGVLLQRMSQWLISKVRLFPTLCFSLKVRLCGLFCFLTEISEEPLLQFVWRCAPFFHIKWFASETISCPTIWLLRNCRVGSVAGEVLCSLEDANFQSRVCIWITCVHFVLCRVWSTCVYSLDVCFGRTMGKVFVRSMRKLCCEDTSPVRVVVANCLHNIFSTLWGFFWYLFFPGHVDMVFDLAWLPTASHGCTLGQGIVTASHDNTWRAWTPCEDLTSEP